jgi:hypothetical protein
MSKSTQPEGGITWIASYPKSGNTWLRAFLACYLNHGNPVSLNALPKDLSFSDARAPDYYAASPYPVHRLDVREVFLIRGAVLLKILAETSHRPLFVKTHNANATVSEVRLMPSFITTRAIHIVRDPRDVLVSFANWTGEGIDKTIEIMSDEKSVLDNIREDAKPVVSVLGSWSRHVSSWLNADFPVATFRYEDMVSEPFETFMKIMNEIHDDPDEATVRAAVEMTSFDRLKAFEEKYGFRERAPDVDAFFRKGEVGQWKNVLTNSQSDRIVSDHGEVMARLGYTE